jgi:hypothetical protein
MAPDEDVVDAVIEGLIRFETAFRPVLAETINAGGDDHLVAKLHCDKLLSGSRTSLRQFHGLISICSQDCRSSLCFNFLEKKTYFHLIIHPYQVFLPRRC